jgi:hypothetical protein
MEGMDGAMRPVAKIQQDGRRRRHINTTRKDTEHCAVES